MAALLSEKANRIESSESTPQNPAAFLLGLSAFLIGLIPSLLHNWIFCESRIMLSTDGKHFLTTVSLLVEYLQKHAFNSDAAKFLADSNLAGHIMFDGPLMSLIYAPVFLVLKKVPTPQDWLTLAYGQSFFHAASTALLSLLVLRLTGSRLFAVIGAIFWGLYPPAVLQTGHFMSELPVTALLLTLLLLLTQKTKLFLSWIGAGVCASLIALSKPALMPCVFLAVLIALEKSRPSNPPAVEPAGAPAARRLWGGKLLSALVIGMALITIPWGAVSYKSTGSFFPTAQRQPLFNVVTGWNSEADGWAYNPHTPFTKLFSDEDSPVPTAMGIWMSRPQESVRLAVSKLSRLTSCPWNDFKGRSLGVDENAQILLHRLLIACAAFGAGMYLFCCRRYLNHNQRSIIEIASAMIFAHLCYLMVECQPRYGFTAMPFATLLAVYGIWQVSRLTFQDPLRRLIIVSSVACALGTTAFLLHAENLCRQFDPRALKERSHTLAMLDKVEKNIDLTGLNVPTQPRAAVLLVDGDTNLSKCRVEVNGVELSGKLLPTMHFDSAHYALFDQLREFGPAMRISVDDFRQWRAIPVPLPLLNNQGNNRIVLTNLAKTATIYGDRRTTRYILSPDYCNYGLLAAAPVAAGAESRFTDPVLTGCAKQASFITGKGNATNSEEGTETVTRETLKDALRIRLMYMLPEAAAPQVLPQSDSANAVESIAINRESFDRMLWDSSSTDCLRINKVILNAARTVGADIPLPKLENKSHIKIRIKGELKALKNAGAVGLLSALKGQNGSVQILGKTPRALQATNDWHKFQIEDTVPLDSLGGKADAIELALYPCPWMEGQYGVSRRATDAVFRNITVEVNATEFPSLNGRRLIY